MKAYKYRNGLSVYDNNGNSLFYRDVETLFNNKIYSSTISELNDPNESNVDDKSILFFLKTRKSEIYQEILGLKKQLSNLGIYSLSMTYHNELLWSYYASGHKGFTIEYDLDYLITSFTYSQEEKMCYFIDINYSSRVPRIKSPIHLRKLFNPNTDGIIKFYLGNKSKKWKHEEEARLILEKKGLIEYDYRAVTGIYFGYRMENSEIDYIMNKMKGRGIRYYQMKLSKYYILDAYSIEDKYYDCAKYIVNNISYFYHDKVEEAIKVVCSKPLVDKIIGVKIHNDNILKIEIFAKSCGIYPLKEFLFVLDEKKRMILIEDIERKKRILQKKIIEMSFEDY